MTAAQPKRIFIGTDSPPITLFSVQGGRFVGAVCMSGAVVLWAVDSGTVALKASMAPSSPSSSSFDAHVVEFGGHVRIVASQANLESGMRLLLFEVSFEGLRPELKHLCRFATGFTCIISLNSLVRLLTLLFAVRTRWATRLTPAPAPVSRPAAECSLLASRCTIEPQNPTLNKTIIHKKITCIESQRRP